MSTFYIQFLYFVIYSFIGWCCETTYCSVLQKQFVNRGPRGRVAMPLAYEHLKIPYPNEK
ncbi:hypothetical protein D1N53_24610 [Clostridioides difficile]|nr:hypothetical protein D1N53_24610 [Clostridioides difficile]